MTTEPKCQTEAHQPELPKDGWTLEQTLQAHAGMGAARTGQPYSRAETPYWQWGFISYSWMNPALVRSWERH